MMGLMNFWSRPEVPYIFFHTASTQTKTRRTGSPAAKAESKSSKSTRNMKKRERVSSRYAPQTQPVCKFRYKEAVAILKSDRQFY